MHEYECYIVIKLKRTFQSLREKDIIGADLPSGCTVG